MKELKPSGLFYVPVGKVCNHPHKVDFELWYYTDWNLNNPKIEIGFDFEIIGSVTAEHIDFDPEPFLVDTGKYMDGNLYWCYGDESDKYAWADIAYRSLLTANDVHFVNPYGEKEPSYNLIDYGVAPGAYSRYAQERVKWQQAESKLVEKILILKKFELWLTK